MSTFKFTSVIQNNYSVDVFTTRGKIKKHERLGFAYYPLMDGEKYNVQISNQNPTRCDAHVWINKKKIGVKRLNPNQTVTIKNLTYRSNRRFTAPWVTSNCHELANGLVKVTFKPEAGSCGYGCVAEYTNYCTNWHKTTVGPTGPKGENGVVTPQNAKCMFGPSVMDQMDHMYNKNFTSKMHDDSWSNGYRKSALKKTVPLLKDIDYSRITTLQCRLIDQ